MGEVNNELSRSPAWFQAIFTRSQCAWMCSGTSCAALPPDRAAGVVTAIGNRLTERLCDMEIDEPTDDAMVLDLAPILAALRHSALRPAVARSPVDRPALQSTPLRIQDESVEG